MTINVVETIRKIMGWCPNATAEIFESSQQIDFVNTSLEPLGISNAEIFQSKNVMFPANISIFSILIVTVLNIGLFLVRSMDYTILILIMAGMYLLFYFFAVKTFHSNISIDEIGVHLRSFELRNITLKYNDIKSFTLNKPIKSTTMIIVLLAIPLTLLVSLIAYSAIIHGKWQMAISIVPLMPGYLLVKHKLDREYHNMDTQLSIQCENKNRYTRWYESISYYSIVTDEITAYGMVPNGIPWNYASTKAIFVTWSVHQLPSNSIK
jgi:hypothetical protein